MEMKPTDYEKELNLNYNFYKQLLDKTIYHNPYIKLNPYPLQTLPIIEANRPTTTYNDELIGAGGFGGKTILGAMLSAQYLQHSKYQCLVTRLHYQELTGPNSIWSILTEWCNTTCEINSTKLYIKSPAGALIQFKAFDHEKRKEKVKSESYTRIVNDEASELKESILRFLFRSLRKEKNNPLPLSFINLSNPGGDSTEYLAKTYVTGNKPYFALDWRHNPFIDKEQYKASLENLDYIDQQYQLYGNWQYKPSVGDLLSRAEGEAQLITNLNTPLAYEIISIDLAGKGKDMFAVVCYDYLANGLEYIKDFNQTQSHNPETLLLDFIRKHNPDIYTPRTSVIVIEQEGGGSPEYAKKYFQEMINEYGYNIPVILKKPSGSKYQRARPLMHSIRYGNTKLNKESEYMNDFIDESIQLSPDGKGRSPNLVDSASLARNYLHTDILGNTITVSVGARIGA